MKRLLPQILVLFSCIGYAQITVDGTLTTQELVENYLISGTCAQVSNFQQSTGTNFGDVNGIGAFDQNGSDFPFAAGVVLSSGDVNNVPGPNLVVHSDGGFGWPGDADLEANTTATNTNNASWIQFDFVPLISEISFDFIMASEEYNQNFECTFSDAFAFILTDQVTGVVQNLAVLPGTMIPIEVTNIREEVPGQCPAVNPEYFDKYNFEPFNVAADAAIDLNGQTVSLTAMGDVIVGNPYTIKLVIADESDTAFDIAVFLEAGSFNIGDVDLGVDLTIDNGTARCEGETFTIIPELDVPGGTTYEWQYEDPLGSGVFVPFVPAETGPTLSITQTGNYKLIVDLAGNCQTEGELFVEFAPFPATINPNPVPLVLCDDDNDGFIAFDLSLSDHDLTGGDPDLVVTYHGTQLDADNGVLPLPNPYTNDDSYNDSVWARVESISSSCYSVVEVLLEVRDSPVAVAPTEPLRRCDDAVADGFTFFDLTEAGPGILGGLDPLEFDLWYYESLADAVAAGDLALTAPDFSAAIPDPTNYLNTSNPQTVYVLVVGNAGSVSPNNGANGCYDIVELELVVDPLPEDLGPFELFLCDDELNGSTPTDEVSTFDLTQVDIAATGGDGTLFVTWYETPADEASDNPIADPSAYQNTSTPQTVVGRIESQWGCRTVVTLTLTVLPNPTPNTSPTPLEACDDDDDGIYPDFDLTSKDAEIVAGDPDVSVLYYASLAEAQAGVAGTELASPYANVVPGGEVVYARVFRDVPPAILGCYTVVELELVVIALPDAPVEGFIDPMLSCDADGTGQAEFDLTQNDPFVIGTQDPGTLVLPVTYHETQADADAGANAIDPATAYVSAGGTVWARLESSETGCARVTPFELVVGEFPSIGTPDDLFECDGAPDPYDGVSAFDLTANTGLLTGGDPDLTVSYYASAADQASDLPIADPAAYQNEQTPQQEIFVTVRNGDLCPAPSSFFINVEAVPTAPQPDPLVACDDDNDGFYNGFDLTSADAFVANGEPVSVAWYGTLEGAQNADPGDLILSPYENVVPFVQVVWARATNDVPPGVNACWAVTPMELRVEQLPSVPDPELFSQELVACDDDGDGVEPFDLTVQDAGALGSNSPASDYMVSYHTDQADAEAGTNAIDPATAYVSAGGTVWARVWNVLTGCARVTPFELVVEPLPELGPGPFVMLSCDDELGGSTPTDGVSTFDLTSNDGAITLGVPYQVEYYASAQDQADGNPIAGPTAYQNASNPQIVYVSVFSGAGCESVTTVTLTVLPNPSPVEPSPLSVCDGSGDPGIDVDGYDGLSTFDLTSKEAEILDGEPDVAVTWHESEADALAGANAIADPALYANTEPWLQVVWARVEKEVPPALLGCSTVVPLELVVDPLPSVGGTAEDLVACEVGTDGVALFDLTANDALLLGGQDPLGFGVLYFRSLAEAQAGTGAIATPSSYANESNPQEVFAGIVDLSTGCYAPPLEDPTTGEVAMSFFIEVKEGAQAFEPEAYVICDNREPSDGLADFTLLVDPGSPTELDAQAQALADALLGGQDPTVYLLSFHATEADALAGEGALPNVYGNVSNPQVVWARVTNGQDPADALACSAVVPVTLVVEQLPELSLDGEYRLCVDADGNPVPEESGGASPPVLDTGLGADGYSFLWSLDGSVLPNEVGPSVVALAAGTYTVVVTELATGCQVEATAVVALSQAPLDFGAESLGAFGGEHTIEAWAEGLGAYWFSLDGGPYQDSGTFSGVSPGDHVVSISDINGCGTVEVSVGVVDYPRFVTPNNDGYHDTWNVIGIAQADPTARIYIFDRYGKLLKQISPMGPGWDGTYNGQPLPSSDYWFRIEYEEAGKAREFSGHFTLKR